MNEFDEIFDFVVVGSGGGSMCAGLVMRARGRSVVVLEKTNLVGGTTARSGGVMWVPNNPIMLRDGVPDSLAAATAYLEAVADDSNGALGSTYERRQTYLAEAPRMVGFLISQGIKLTRARSWPDYYDEQPGGSVPGRTVVAELFNLNELGHWKEKLRPGMLSVPAMLEEAIALPTFNRSWKGKRTMLKVAGRVLLAKLTGKQWATAGAALQGRMLQAALKAGVEIRTGSAVSELIEEQERIVGVVGQCGGRPWRVGAKLGVLVNAGGFAHNQRMRDQYQPGTSSQWSSAAPGDTGEMIEEMMRHGAAIAQMDEMVGNQNTFPPGSETNDVKEGMQLMTASPHVIVVDQTGIRYMNEGGSYMAYCKHMLERNKSVPAVPSWAIFDSHFIDRYMLAGSMPGRKKPQRWYDEGYLRRADTIDGLARLLSIDPAALNSTVARFNDFVARNQDDDFGRGARAYDRWLGDPYHKGSPTLGAIEKSPFFAIPVYPGDVGTYGGVVTDVHARVLRTDGFVIPGLYATGVSTASVMGRAYPGAGSSVGPSFTWGFVASNHAASQASLEGH